MESLTIELLRFGGRAGLLDPLNQYLVLAGNDMPPGARTINLDHYKLLDYIHALRYPSEDKPELLEEAIKTLSLEAEYVLRLKEDLPSPIQIDLVTSASELSAFPFELLLCGKQFTNSNKEVVITRRIRQEFLDKRADWPIQPRVLFAYASPDYINAPAVPADIHTTALRNALKPWIEPLRIPNFPAAVPDESSALTILKDASLETLSNAIQTGHKENKPYTHIHLLAHGVVVAGQYGTHGNQYGLGLESADNTAVTRDQLKDVLKPHEGIPVCITLAVCDGGNTSNVIVPGSLAQSLHEIGIPIVVASQFPLTMTGSGIMTETFYSNLLNGKDVREALLKTRSALKSAEVDGAMHDWVSLSSYVQLPEGYTDYLNAYSLKRQFASLRTVQNWADHIVKNNITDDGAIARVEGTLNERIDSLEEVLNHGKSKDIRGAHEELTGLLGSAYKRKAELEAYASKTKDNDADWAKKSKASLTRSRDYYKEGHDHSFSAHWNGIQHLCLEAVLTGSIAEKNYMHTVELAAVKAVENPSEIWAYGTLTELYLLATIDQGDAILAKAKNALAELVKRASEQDDGYPIFSTRKQLEKYIDWWTVDNGYFPELGHDLSKHAKELIQILPLES